MTRLNLMIAACVALTLGAAVSAHAQKASPSTCGVEAWSTDKMAYVSVPCASGAEQTVSQTAKAPASQNCGIETYSVDKQAYVSTPCAAGTTYENPTGKATENPNTK